MPIKQAHILAATGTTAIFNSASGGYIKRGQYPAQRIQTAFLCHSHRDKDLAEKLQQFLENAGISLYIDWQHCSLDQRPGREQIQEIQSKIQSEDIFLHLSTANSINSKWCPWELGFADAHKGVNRIFIIPTEDNAGNKYGVEYMDIYRKIDNHYSGRISPIERGSIGSAIQIPLA